MCSRTSFSGRSAWHVNPLIIIWKPLKSFTNNLQFGITGLVASHNWDWYVKPYSTRKWYILRLSSFPGVSWPIGSTHDSKNNRGHTTVCTCMQIQSKEANKTSTFKKPKLQNNLISPHITDQMEKNVCVCHDFYNQPCLSNKIDRGSRLFKCF